VYFGIFNIMEKTCPICGELQVYSINGKSIYMSNKYIKENYLCRSCSQKGKTPHNKNPITTLERNCPVCNTLLKYKNRKSFFEACRKNKICKSCCNKRNASNQIGKKLSEEHKNKLSQARLEILKRTGGINISFNSRACDYFDKLNEERNWKLQHALNGGETQCGRYFLDAYDKKKNIVVEYNEPYHHRVKQIEKDNKRREFIINKLGCQFFIFDELNQKLDRYCV
jgi:hypothetical protein